MNFTSADEKPGNKSRGANGKTIVIAAVEKQRRKLGQIRLEVIPDHSKDAILPFINKYVEPGSIIISDGLKGYHPIEKSRNSNKQVISSKAGNKESVLPGVHLIASLDKRLIRSTFQGRFDPEYFQNYLDEYVF